MVTARVFPRRTKATPTDPLAYVGDPGLFPPECDRVDVSVTFTWDLPEAERLAKVWAAVAPVSIGGPATGQRGESFMPGQYLKEGYVITSRGCPNNCWFCVVPKRDGPVRELPITEGWHLQDDNLLACSEGHIRAVFAMLRRQPQRAELSGGLEAARLKPWIVEELRQLNPRQVFFAYDSPADRDAIHAAGEMLQAAGLKRNHPLRAYVLVGHPRDTFETAEDRLMDCFSAGFMPMAMLYRDSKGERDPAWMRFQKRWARPAIIAKVMA